MSAAEKAIRLRRYYYHDTLNCLACNMWGWADEPEPKVEDHLWIRLAP